jgi:uncharacterized protein YjiS (DUF1127 family)
MAHTSTGLVDGAAVAGRSNGNGPLQLAARAFAWIAEQRRINRTIAMLSNLSDHTLADIGVERGDIPRVARYGRDTLRNGSARDGHIWG